MRIILKSFLILFSLLATVSLSFAEDNNSQEVVNSDKVTILIVGTKHFSDVNIIHKNIKKNNSIQNLLQTVSSQNHIALTGTFSGSADSVIADIEGLAQDRYEVQKKNDKNQGLIITLRKIADKPQ